MKDLHIYLDKQELDLLAGAIQGLFASVYKENCPITTIVEASEAAWIYKSAVANDGNLRMVDGDMPTIMAGLACGEANITGMGCSLKIVQVCLFQHQIIFLLMV